jgi:hypothetical protein
MAKLLETWRNCTQWLFAADRNQFAGPANTSSKAYMREWRRRQIESIREAQLRQRAKERHQD